MNDWHTMSREQRGLAYNNSAAVADAAAILAARAQASQAFRGGGRGRLDIAYGPGERQRFDLFAAAEPGAPCLVFIHGGYWQMGGREAVSVLAEGPLAHGWSVAFPGYTLAPEASITQIVAEIHAALDWLATHGAAHGIAGKLLLSGHSAGGHLTALAASHPAVVAAMPVSGVFELGPIRDTPLNERLSLTDAEIAAFSPLRLPVVDRPMAVAYGTAELAALVEDSRTLHAWRSAAHAPGPLLPVPRANHFDILDELRRPEGMLMRALLELARAG